MNSELAVRMLDRKRRLSALSDKDAEYWKFLIDKYIINSPYVSVAGNPSKVTQERMEKEETERIQKQVEDFGKERLESLQKQLDEAKAFSEIPIPHAVLEKFPVLKLVQG
jgi:Zn-dependent M16 (insulinase) family peptidase